MDVDDSCHLGKQRGRGRGRHVGNESKDGQDVLQVVRAHRFDVSCAFVQLGAVRVCSPCKSRRTFV